MRVLWLLVAIAVSASADIPQPHWVGDFAGNSLEGWKEKSFVGMTKYRLLPDGGATALRAESEAAASGLVKNIEVDLETTPTLHWSWKVEMPLNGNREREKAGDDYAVRIYVVFSGGWNVFRPKAINYVWSSHQAVGAEWPNAYTDNARMIAVASNQNALGQWHHFQRDVRADYLRLFGEEPAGVRAVAIMTDTDDTRQKASAWYGDIWFAP